MLLTQGELDAYHRDGFLAPVDVMTREEAGALRLRLEEAERRHAMRLNANHRNNAHYEFLFMDEIVHDPRVLDVVEQIVGPDILLWSTVLFIKGPQSEAHVSFHQDARYMGLEPQRGVTAWLALTDATLENGCMLAEPGSHLGPMREHEDTFEEHNILTRGQSIEAVDRPSLVPLELQAGQMSLHHVRTVHGSAPNRSSDRRIGVALQAFFSPDTVQTKGQDFALLVRGQDSFGHFDKGRRPLADAEPEGHAFRKRANDRFAEILYQGAEQKRAL